MTDSTGSRVFIQHFKSNSKFYFSNSSESENVSIFTGKINMRVMHYLLSMACWSVGPILYGLLWLLQNKAIGYSPRVDVGCGLISWSHLCRFLRIFTSWRGQIVNYFTRERKIMNKQSKHVLCSRVRVVFSWYISWIIPNPSLGTTALDVTIIINFTNKNWAVQFWSCRKKRDETYLNGHS